MAIRTIDDIKLQNIAVAIQNKDGGGQMTVEQMPTRIAAIPTQDNTILNSLINRSITSIESSEVTSIGPYAFCSCTSLTSVSLPNATSIKSYAFNSCTQLVSISLPNATSIEGNAFSYSTQLANISLPNATRIEGRAFAGCTQLVSVILGKRATLSSSNAFNDANRAIIYVQPEDLTWYSTATNWSTLYTAGRIKSIEELPT